MSNIQTPNNSNKGTIDITDLVESLKASFVTWATAYIYGLELAIPDFGAIVALPILSSIDKEIIKSILTALANSEIMVAFFINTAVKKASQAGDYIDARNAILNLPTNASLEDFSNAEKKEIAAFRNFVSLTN